MISVIGEDLKFWVKQGINCMARNIRHNDHNNQAVNANERRTSLHRAIIFRDIFYLKTQTHRKQFHTGLYT